MIDYSFSNATTGDLPFIIECILAAEASGTKNVSYCTILNINKEEFEDVLLEILSENIPGYELSWMSFIIARRDGERAGGFAAWIEGEGNSASNAIKSMVLPYFFGVDRWKAAAESMKILQSVAISREAGSLQFEEIYVAPRERGKGLTSKMLEYGIEMFKEKRVEISKAQIILVNTNKAAESAYRKAGFEINEIKVSDDPRVEQVISGNGKILMEKEI